MKKDKSAPGPEAQPEKLLDLEEGFEIWRIPPMMLKEQDKNAQVQPPSMFKALVRNVSKRKALESLPFCGRSEGTFWIISGHHRVRAAITAALRTIVVLVDPQARTRAEIVAKQVAHNSISGSSDPSVLLQLLDEIDDVDALLESAVDRNSIEKLAAPIAVPDVAVDYDWKTVTFAFLPHHIKNLDSLCDALRSSDRIMTAETESHSKLAAAMKALGHADEIRSTGAIINRMVEIVSQYVADKKVSAVTDAQPQA